MKKFLRLLLMGSMVLLGVNVLPVRSEEQPAEVQAAIRKGLRFLADAQSRADGHWEHFPARYPTKMTALAGMAMLHEGSTLKEGKYQKNIRKAVDFVMSQAQPSGQLGNPHCPGDQGDYMYTHGYALLFLSCAYGEEDDQERRKELREVLTRAAQFTRDAQTKHVLPRDPKTKLGGWGYVSARDGNNFDVCPVAVTQMQGLRAAQNVGIKTSKDTLQVAQAYLVASTSKDGGVVFSLGKGAGGDGQWTVTSGALSAGDKDPTRMRNWLRFVEKYYQPLDGGYSDYAHYYYSQALYRLGDEGYAKLMKDVAPKDRKNWSWYKKENFPKFLKSQTKEGGWDIGNLGPVYSTSIILAILQLENGALPLYQR